MSTIAYRSGVLAADRRVSHAGWTTTKAVVKIAATSDGGAVGLVGAAHCLGPFFEWAAGTRRGPPPKMPEGTIAIVISPDGKVREYESDGFCDLLPAEFYAWGSGFPVALGALLQGASAAGAVEIASCVEPDTGDGIETVVVAPPPATAHA